MSSGIRKFLFFSIFSLVIITIFLSNAGNYLVKEDNPVQSEAILILMGSTGDRVRHAYNLYQEGYADRFLMVSDYEPGRELFSDKGIQIPNCADKARKILEDSGIPHHAIGIIPGDANSTAGEARFLRLYFIEHKVPDTIILVTSAYHTRRSAIIFNATMRSLNNAPVIIVSPSPYCNFNAKKWWKDRNSAKALVMEYAKLLYFLCWESFKS